MRTAVLTVLLGLSTLAWAETRSPEITCKDIQLMADVSVMRTPPLEKTGLSVVVTRSSAGKRGYVAEFSARDGEAWQEPDVAIEFTQPADTPNFIELLEAVSPDVRLKDVKRVRAVVIATQAAMQDGGGVILMEAMAADGRSLTKLAQVGWSFGKCSE